MKNTPTGENERCIGTAARKEGEHEYIAALFSSIEPSDIGDRDVVTVSTQSGNEYSIYRRSEDGRAVISNHGDSSVNIRPFRIRSGAPIARVGEPINVMTEMSGQEQEITSTPVVSIEIERNRLSVKPSFDEGPASAPIPGEHWGSSIANMLRDKAHNRKKP